MVASGVAAISCHNRLPRKDFDLRFIIACLLLFTNPASAQGFGEFGSWRVIVDEFDTGQDVRRDCKMLTGGDGEPSVHVSMYSGDVGPPDYYPTVRVTEPTYRGYPTLLQDDQKLYAWFDSEETFNAKASKYINKTGSPVTEIVFADHQSLAMLQTMRLNDQMDIVVNGQVFMTAFLDGFTASYLKMAGECGFSGVGVVN